jgi:hypothetical protein
VSHFYERIYDPGLNITRATLRGYYEVFEQTAQKIKTFLREREKDDLSSIPHSLSDVYMYLTSFNDLRNGKGAVGCDRWYYRSLGGYRKNAYFLFGTPYQFR